MKISYKWLCELIPGLDKTPAQELAHKLTMSGLEVEESVDQSTRFEKFIVAQVESIEKHPDADKLRVCQVNIGKEKVQVVCGAPNVATGKKYPFAGLGTVLPGGMEIKPVKLRGVDSFGMLCSERELELSESHEGLMLLDDSLKVGKSIALALGLDDKILEVNVTPNRGDALSHWGVAADISAITGLKVDYKKLVPASVKLSSKGKQGAKSSLKLTHTDKTACRRFTGSQITNVKIQPSPAWLKTRLESLDIRSINNVVDATNYVLMLTGHPVHSYDADNISGHEIKIYSLDKPLKYKTLDSLERELVKGDLVIGAAKGPVGLAGIMGGENSEIKDSTKDLILEVAFFDPDTIRKTSRRLGLQTESSYRFARFVNPDTVYRAHEILRDLILALAGGEATKIVDSYSKPFERLTIELENTEITRILGITIPGKDVLKILKGLCCEVKEKTGKYIVSPPIGRSDLTRPIDLIEELARIYGLDKIPAEMPQLGTHYSKESPASILRHEIKDILVYQGFHETLHYSFGDPSFMKKVLRPQNTDSWIELKNFLSEDLAVMRPSLLPHLLQAYLKNRLNTQKGLRLFEQRNVYSYLPNKEIQEKEVLAFIFAGNPYGRNRIKLNRDSDFYDAQGILELIFSKAKIEPVIKPYKDWPFHPGKAAACYLGDQRFACFGALHPTLMSELKIREKVYYAEIDFDLFAQNHHKGQFKYQTISSLPSVYRDLSLVVSKSLSFEDIVKVIEEEKPGFLHHYELFDLFEGGNLGEDQKSITFSMVYEAKSQSLTDEEVNSEHFALVEKLKSKLGAQLR